VAAMVVEIAGSTPSLAQAMSRMRDWLDQRGCTPVRFEMRPEQPGSIVIRVEFADNADAAAFRATFGPVQPEAPAAVA